MSHLVELESQCPKHVDDHIHNTNMEEHEDDCERENFCYAVQLAFSSVLPMSLHAAAELGAFDIIAGAGRELSGEEIAAQLPTRNPEAGAMLDRILRLLASHSVLKCRVVGDEKLGLDFYKRVYSLSPVAKYFVTNEDGVSLKPFMALIQDKVILDSWSHLKDAILEGGLPFNRAHNVHAFEYAELDQRFNKLYNTAMYNVTTIVVKKILESYKGFEQIKNLVDVGGNLGVTLSLIVPKYPHIKATNFDLPQVIEHAPVYPGVEHVGGDMFETVPTGDAILLKSILHDWSDEKCLKILENCYKATPENGKVIVIEEILPVMPEMKTAVKSTSQTDVIMMTKNPGGKERSQHEFLALATMAGFSGIKFERCGCNYWVMEFCK